jgi:hypothetical protein
MTIAGDRLMTPERGDTSGLDSRCGGSGFLACNRMGDGCCCGFHGEAECYGCQDCDCGDDEYYQDDDEQD